MKITAVFLAGCAGIAMVVGASLAEPSARPSNDLSQIGPDGLPATSEDKATTEQTPRDMAPNVPRVAQQERPSDQHLTIPPPPTTGTEAKAITLSQVDQPDKTLLNAPVESKDGHKIGEVAQVMLDATGKANEIVLNDRARTRLAAGELVFQPDRGVLITQLSPSDLAPATNSKPISAPPHSLAPEETPQAPDDDKTSLPPPDLPDTRPGHNGF